MSAETEFRAALVAHTALSDLVGTRIAQNAVPDGSSMPCVVYASTRTPDFHLDNSVGATNVQFEVQCWASTSAEAAEVADEVEAALLAVYTVCTARSTTFDPEMGLDGEILTADWWE